MHMFVWKSYLVGGKSRKASAKGMVTVSTYVSFYHLGKDAIIKRQGKIMTLYRLAFWKQTYKTCDMNETKLLLHKIVSSTVQFLLDWKICTETTLTLNSCGFVLCVLVPQCLGEMSMGKFHRRCFSVFSSIMKVKDAHESLRRVSSVKRAEWMGCSIPHSSVPSSMYFEVFFFLHSIYTSCSTVEAELESPYLMLVQVSFYFIALFPLNFKW